MTLLIFNDSSRGLVRRLIIERQRYRKKERKKERGENKALHLAGFKTTASRLQGVLSMTVLQALRHLILTRYLCWHVPVTDFWHCVACFSQNQIMPRIPVYWQFQKLNANISWAVTNVGTLFLSFFIDTIKIVVFKNFIIAHACSTSSRKMCF